MELNEILNNFIPIDRVKQVYLLDSEGKNLAHLVKPGLAVDNILVLARQSVLFGRKLVSILKKKDFKQTYLEFKSFNMTVEILAGNYFLVIVSENGVNLGRVRLEIRRHKSLLENALNKIVSEKDKKSKG